jgi:hypothetical protein
MPAVYRPALALILALAVSLSIATLTGATDRGTDQRGDAARAGVDILSVTTTFSDADLTIDVELAGDWAMSDSEMQLLVGTTDSPEACAPDYTIQLEGPRQAILMSIRSPQRRLSTAASVDGPHVTVVLPLRLLGFGTESSLFPDPATLYLSVIALDGTFDQLGWDLGADPGDLFPDTPGWPDELGCRAIAVPVASSPSPAPSAAPAATGPEAGPWLTVLPVTLLVAVAGLLAYDWLVAEQRWRVIRQ